MWKNYSADFIRKNRASSLSIMAAAFISALFLSLLNSLFYNFWNYEIESIVLEEGGWQGRITGDIDENTLALTESFANVERVVIKEDLSGESNITVDFYFQNMRTVYQDMPLIADKLGIEETSISYHEELLSRYMIHDPEDKNPPLLMAFYVMLLVIMSISLILIIHNSFAVSMNERIRQFGIFSSIGATPGQIRTCLLQEAGALCTIPVLLGNLLGTALCFGIIQLTNSLGSGISGRHEAVFKYHPLIFVLSVLVSGVTVFLSALIPAAKLAKLTPLEAVRGSGEMSLKKKRNSRFLSLLFGVEGELAGNALRAQKKSLRTSTLSLTLSFLGFTVMLCFFTLSGISTEHTYFERYQDAWDVMVTVPDTAIEDFESAEEIRNLENVRSSVVYQKQDVECLIAKTDISGEVEALGGLDRVAGSSVSAEDDFYKVKAPVIIMDDNSFSEYCSQIGVEGNTDGTIVLNRIWDNIHSNFRYKEFVPFLKEEAGTITLESTGEKPKTVSLPVLAYTQEAPLLREEYDNYSLVQFISLSTWMQIQDLLGKEQGDTLVRIMSEENADLTQLNALEREIAEVTENYSVEIENRIQEKLDNDKMIQGYMFLIGAFCVLLAIIGISNVFSNTLGFLRSRKREFARYLSVGMTPKGIRKIFCIEALMIAGRPVLITLPLTILFVSFMITASYLDPAEFLEKAPILPIAVFILAIFGFVALAYYIGGKKIEKLNLAEALRDENLD